MWFQFSSDLTSLSAHIPHFLALVGEKRWFKRADHLEDEQRKSPYRWKIVADYHWLEMAISCQSDVLTKNGRLLPELVDPQTLAALHFAGAVVEVHSRLPPVGQRQLEGRLRDGLNAESGFAALYLELDLALRLISEGYDVRFPDLDGSGKFDLEFSRGDFVGEVECKSLSPDAGRKIHRKDFFRFMETMVPALDAHSVLNRPEILTITLRNRLSPNHANQAGLRRSATAMLRDDAPTALVRPGFHMERCATVDCLPDVPIHDQNAFYAGCCEVFGPNIHVAGGFTETGGCVIVMRSEQEDDTSKPLLEAMRKAASQLTGTRPAFIAVQFQDIKAPDLMLPHLRRRTGILSYALFEHYGAAHVSAAYFCGFAAVMAQDGRLGTPAFAIPNPKPRFSFGPRDASPFMANISDAEFAASIGTPLPAADISSIQFDDGPSKA